MAKVTHHCSICGEQVDEFCTEHPEATVEPIVGSYGESATPKAVNAKLADIAAREINANG